MLKTRFFGSRKEWGKEDADPEMDKLDASRGRSETLQRVALFASTKDGKVSSSLHPALLFLLPVHDDFEMKKHPNTNPRPHSRTTKKGAE